MIVRLVLRMMLQGQFSVSILDLVQSSISRNTQNLVVVPLPVGIVLIKEFSLTLVHHGAMLLPKFLEGLFSIIIGVLLLVDFVVVGPSVSVGQHIIGLAYLMELLLGLFSAIFMLVWMPFGGKFLVGLIHIILGSVIV